MKAKDLISMLSDLDPNAEVRFWSEDDDEYMPVTGCYHDEGGLIDLCCACEP